MTSDIMVGMKAALADLEKRLGNLPRFKYRLASSSAAGGLRMVTVGLVRELTAEAARRAALGAGARLVGTFANRLTRADVEHIVALAPDILLLAGGTDGGNSEVILYNAAALGSSALVCPVVLAGNRNAADEAATLLAGREVVRCDNVMPEFNVLDIEPARTAVRRVFIERIVHAKGIDRAQAEFDQVLMPTPAAVMEGARLIADGCEGIVGLGPLLVVDPG
ncbi:MAG: MutL protein, partial [Betaproteobacteria bacterium]